MMLARDERSCTGRKVGVMCGQIVKVVLLISAVVDIARQDSWRVKYLETSLQHRQQWHYPGDKDEEERVQNLIYCLCVN